MEDPEHKILELQIDAKISELSLEVRHIRDLLTGLIESVNKKEDDLKTISSRVSKIEDKEKDKVYSSFNSLKKWAIGLVATAVGGYLLLNGRSILNFLIGGPSQ